jgi:hypothetical protein
MTQAAGRWKWAAATVLLLVWPSWLAAADPDPLQFEFHRVGVRRLIFSNNLPLSELAPSEFVQGSRPLAAGDQVVFSGRYEGATVKAATQDFPEIRGYITQVRRRE